LKFNKQSVVFPQSQSLQFRQMAELAFQFSHLGELTLEEIAKASGVGTETVRRTTAFSDEKADLPKTQRW